MKKRMLRVFISLIVFASVITALSGCTPSPGKESVEDAVLSYTAEYIPLESISLDIQLEDVAGTIGIANPDLKNYSVTGSVRAKTFNRGLSGREYGGLVKESYYFDKDTLGLRMATAIVSFYAPKKYCESEELHAQVVDEGVVYVREFYDRLKAKYEECYGIVLDATSDGITKDSSIEDFFLAAGDNGKEYVGVTIYFSRNELLTKSDLAGSGGSYEYCNVQINMRKHGDTPVHQW